MTLTFNPDKYKELLTVYLPKVIKTESENEQALAKLLRIYFFRPKALLQGL